MILALPFTRLRAREGAWSVWTSAREAALHSRAWHGTGRQDLQGTTSRVWRTPEFDLPAPSNGAFYSDLGFQNLWDSSREPAGRARDHHRLYRRLSPAWATPSPRSTPSAPTFPRCRPRWPKSSTPTRSARFSGVYPIHARQLCQRQSQVNTPRSSRWRRNRRLTAACNLLASIPAATSLAS